MFDGNRSRTAIWKSPMSLVNCERSSASWFYVGSFVVSAKNLSKSKSWLIFGYAACDVSEKDQIIPNRPSLAGVESRLEERLVFQFE